MRDSVRIFAPATVANVGSAFDILGFALEAPGDTVVARKRSTPGIIVSRVVSPYGAISADPATNTASVAAAALLERINAREGLELELYKDMPLGSGLGSSAASAAAGVLAAKLLFDADVSESVLVECAMEGERAACGTAHADNVAPSLLGGIVLLRSYHPLDLVRINVPAGLHYAVVCPRIEVRTEDARKVLRREVRLKDAVVKMGNVAGLIAGFFHNDHGLIGRSLQDILIEPERAALIPGFEDARLAALAQGALGCGISGSGPSIFALTSSAGSAERCGEAIGGVFKRLGIEVLMFHNALGGAGARAME